MTEVRQIYDRFGGVVRTIHYHGASETWYTSARANVQPVLDFNKAMQNEGHNGFTPSRGMRHVAKVHPVIYENWIKEYCQIRGLRFFGNRDRDDWMTFLKSKLNNDDNKFLRTVEGKL